MANTGDPLGVGIACTSGYPLRMVLCWGNENLGNSIIRRLNSDEGSLASIGDDSDYGFNVVNYLNASFDRSQPGALAAFSARIRSEVEKDPRVQRAQVRVIAGGDTLTIYIDGMTANGPFSLVLGVGELTVERLNQGLPGQTPTVNL
jgi:hypothetical protein